METTTLTIFKKTVQYSGQNIWIKPVCEFFDLNVQNQQRKLKKDKILGNLWIKKSTDLGEIDKNGRILLSKKGFIRWIQLINFNTIRQELQDSFIQFQEMIFDYLYGKTESEQQAKIDYMRLKRLKNLYAKIGREIQRVEKGFNNYLENRFVQYKLDFSK